ncbi:MarR family transcriptional regulator [Calidifontibacter sp. DB0510]|uniref:MarR family transcriptional regulator n=2 Tax=Metallococcus carri TaxID=1656884 RepID=A0A967AYV7_9MICO|nr:MarR family transcriptional regulator [Metallococcus carri]NOP38212.1 MarR family transcriptional regulator [Calidifontibacter sp. DB2511S]
MRISRRARFENVDQIAPHQFSVLAKLEAGAMTPRQLADAECVSAPSMTRTLNCLSDKGFVSRAEDRDDRRKTWIQLTKEGQKIVRATRRSRDEWMEQRIDALTEQECAVLAQAAEILGRVVAR